MRFETLSFGWGLVEGPRADAAGNLFFSDVRGGGVYRLSADGAVTTVVPKRRGVGGIAIHADGGLVISGRDVCHVRRGETRVLFRADGVAGFNDLVTDGAGRLYVGSVRSDPFDMAARVPGELYRIEPGGAVAELYGEVGLSNGLGFSPDGRRLYHSDTKAGCVLVHDVDGGGGVRNRRVFAEIARGLPDGLAVDEAGGVWVALYGGGAVGRWAPDGRLDRTIDVPAREVTSLCFGAADARELYVVTADNAGRAERRGTIFRARVAVAGLPVPLARV